MLKIILTAVSILLLLQIPASSDSVYVWTDEKGVKHYSNTGPSESVDEYLKENELSSEPTTHSKPLPVTSETAPPAAALPDTPADTQSKEEDGSADPVAEYLDATRLKLDDFPKPQGYLVQREKSIVAGLLQALEDPGVDRIDVIARERKRLLQTIRTLEQAPLEKFGSQKNKLRQVGYYKYRVEALISDPDAYFQYPYSDTD